MATVRFEDLHWSPDSIFAEIPSIISPITPAFRTEVGQNMRRLNDAALVEIRAHGVVVTHLVQEAAVAKFASACEGFAAEQGTAWSPPSSNV